MKGLKKERKRRKILHKTHHYKRKTVKIVKLKTDSGRY